jgi:drug/metabolite transporter (DMT)-like permease
MQAVPDENLHIKFRSFAQRMMLRGAAYGITASAIWGGMYVVSDVVLDTIPPFTLLTLRLILGGLALLPFVLSAHGIRRLSARDALRLMGVGLIGFGVSLGAQFVGTDLSTAINGTLITSASPAFIVLFGVMLLREQLTAARLAAVGFATIGVIIIVNPASISFGTDTALGDLSLALAALTWGLYSVLVRMVSRQIDTLLVTLLAFVGGLGLTIPVSVVELQSRAIGEVTLLTVLGVLYLGLVSTATAMWLWNRAFALVPASTASLLFFAQPLVGALLSVVLLGQAMTPTLWIGSFLIVLGVLLALVNVPDGVKRRFLGILRYNPNR